MVETIVVLVVTLLLIMGSIQFALMYTAKSTLNYATFEATRAGALNYADKNAVEFALAMNLSPINTSIKSGDGMFDKINEVKRERNKMLSEIHDGEFVCIERINPPNSAFADHGVADPTGHFRGQLLIPNDHLKYRNSKVKGASQLSLQDANLLKLRVTYCHPMIVPVVSTVIKRLMGVEVDPDPIEGWVKPSLGSFQKNCYTKGRMPIVSQAIVRMQTPVKNDAYASSCQ